MIEASIGLGEILLYGIGITGGYLIGRARGYARGWLDGIRSEDPAHTFHLEYDEDSRSIEWSGLL
jgi:hypothetical protein